MVLTLSQEEFQEMKRAVLDADADEALRIMRLFVKRLEQIRQGGMKSHLDK